MPAMIARALTSFLAISFVMAGLGKLHSSHPMHAEMLAKAPEWLDALGLSVIGFTPDTLRIGIGASELVLGLLLVGTHLAAVGLAILMAGAVFTHIVLDGYAFTQEAIPASVLLFLLCIRLALGNEKPPPVEQTKKDE